MKYLVIDGQLAGSGEGLTADTLPDSSWMIVESDLSGDISKLTWDGENIVLKKVETKQNDTFFAVFKEVPPEEKETFSFEEAIVEAETNNVVLVGLVKALYAKMTGDLDTVDKLSKKFKAYQRAKTMKEPKDV